MAIPTMPGGKRRKNIGNEIAEMMKGFAQGYKAFGGGDDRQSRADARNPYSDQNLAKYDSRINSTPLGRMFRGEEDVTGIDRGALRLQAKIRAAEEQGDVASLKKAQEDLRELYRMQEKGEILGKDRITVGSEKRAEGVPTDVPMPVARPQEFAGAAVDDGMDDGSSNAGSQVAMADPLYNADGYYQPDYQIFAARGGPIPEMPNRLIGIPMSGIDDNRVLTRPVEESDDDYSIDEPTDNDGPPDSAGLPTDPEELAPYAAEAVDAGYRKLSKDLTSDSALSDQDSEHQARVADYNAKTQRMTDDEVAELDRMVDPEGTMPQANRGVARMAAAYKFFKDRGEEDRADDVAARLIQYNEFAGNTRAALGAQAIQQGKVQEGVKLLTDAYEQNIPDGKSVETTINPDGSVSFAVGYKRQGADGKISLSPIEERTIPLKDLPQFAFAISEKGQQELMRSGASAAARRASGGGGAVGGGGGNDVQSALAKVRAAGEEARAAQASGDEERIAKAQAAVTSAVSAANQLPIPRTRTGNQDTGIETRRRNIASALGQVGGGGTTGARETAANKETREAAAIAAAKAQLSKREADVAEDAAYPGAIKEEEQTTLARRKQTQVDMARIAVAAKENPPEELKAKERKEVYADVSETVDKALSAKFNLPSAETKDAKKATLTDTQRNIMVDTAYDLVRRNGLSVEQATRATSDLLRSFPRPDENGMLQVGQFKVALDPQLVRGIASIRGPVEASQKAVNTPTDTSSGVGNVGKAAIGGVSNALTRPPQGIKNPDIEAALAPTQNPPSAGQTVPADNATVGSYARGLGASVAGALRTAIPERAIPPGAIALISDIKRLQEQLKSPNVTDPKGIQSQILGKQRKLQAIQSSAW